MLRMLVTRGDQMGEKAITSDEMYKIEENGHKLLGMRRIYMMENAGHGVADFIVSKFRYNLVGKKIVAVCGTGNNGGDALVACRHLAGYYGAELAIILLGSPISLHSEEASTNWKIIQRMNSIKVFIGNEMTDLVKGNIAEAQIVIDGIFGTGIKGIINDPHASAIVEINNSDAYVVAVDVPSGLDPNTGIPHDKCVHANATVTFHRLKIGLLNNKDYTGTVHLERIGIPREAERGVIEE